MPRHRLASGGVGPIRHGSNAWRRASVAHASGAAPRIGGGPPLRAVLFDAGLTLLRTASSAAQVAVQVLESAGLVVGEGRIDPAMAWAEERIEATWRQGDWFASEAGVRRLFVSSFADGLATIPDVASVPGAPRAMAEAMYDEYQNTRHWSLYPDVRDTIAALARAGLEMGVVSDWGHGLEAILLELGLGPHLHFVVISSRLGIAKPDPTVFALALQRIDVPAGAAVYVGDTYVKDILGARAAGLTPILLDREGGAPDVDCIVIRGLGELPPLLGIARTDPTVGGAGTGARRAASWDRQGDTHDRTSVDD